MSYDGLGVVEEIRQTSRSIELVETKTSKRLEAIEASVNELYRKTQRPGAEGNRDDVTTERKDAAGLCIVKHQLTVPKDDGNTAEYFPSHDEIDEALRAKKALRSLFRHGDASRLDVQERKSLTSFSFGSNSFVLSLRCPTAC